MFFLGSSLLDSLGSIGLGSLGSLGVGVGSKLFDYTLTKEMAEEQFGYQLALLKAQQEWLERMSNTAHQREVADLRSAGLNPILSATGGNGAPVPVAGSPSAPGGAFHPSSDLASSLNSGISSGIALEKLGGQLSQMDADLRLTEQQINTERVKQMLMSAQAGESFAKTAEMNAGLPMNRIPGWSANVLSKFGKEAIGYFNDLMDSAGTALRGEQQKQMINKLYPERKGSGQSSSFKVVPVADYVSYEGSQSSDEQNSDGSYY